MAKAHNPAYPHLRAGAVMVVVKEDPNDGYYSDTVYPDRVVSRDPQGRVWNAGEYFEARARERVGPYHN